MQPDSLPPKVCFYHLAQRPAGSRIVIVERGKIGYTVTNLADARGPTFDARMVKLLNRARNIDETASADMWRQAVGDWMNAFNPSAPA